MTSAQSVAALARRQYGVVARAQLSDRGVSGATISRWVANGRLDRLNRGVYAFGHRSLTHDGWTMAALLAVGPGAAVSYRSAAAGWDLARARSGPVDITSPDQRGGGLRGIRHHRSILASDEVTEHRGFKITTIARTIVDMSDVARPREFGDLLDRALLLRLYDHREMLEALDRARGRHGLGRLHRAIAVLTDDGDRFRSDDERRVRDALALTGHVRAEVNAWLPVGEPGFEVDLLWRSQRLIVEVDGPHHLLPYQRQLDRARDAALTRAGYRVLRLPAEHTVTEFSTVTDVIRLTTEGRK